MLLFKRFEKKKGRKYDQFVECLGDMTVESEHSDFLNYIKEWINKVNLFPLNNMTYCFFVAIEKVVRVLLPRYVIKPSESRSQFKEEIIDKIVKNEDIQWHWTLISQRIDSEEDAVELLEEIVSFWVTIRGFSLAATWMEVYKQETKKTTKKSKGLRKEHFVKGVSSISGSPLKRCLFFRQLPRTQSKSIDLWARIATAFSTHCFKLGFSLHPPRARCFPK